jgi:hypothetical protein
MGVDEQQRNVAPNFTQIGEVGAEEAAKNWLLKIY